MNPMLRLTNCWNMEDAKDKEIIDDRSSEVVLTGPRRGVETLQSSFWPCGIIHWESSRNADTHYLFSGNAEQ